jgi:hypothetical protein
MEQNSVASEEIDAIIKMHDDWRGAMLSRLRSVIRRSDPQIIEEVKWKKPSKPEGIPVWAHNGNLCMADTLKNAVRITFPKGAQMPDPKGLFNTRMDSKTVRAIDFTQHMEIDEPALSALVLEAVKLNRK